MSGPQYSQPAADRNLLFGILAVQMNFVARDALIAAMHAWVLERSKPLGRILVEQQALSPSRQSLLEQLVDEHLAAHDGNVEKSHRFRDEPGVQPRRQSPGFGESRSDPEGRGPGTARSTTLTAPRDDLPVGFPTALGHHAVDRVRGLIGRTEVGNTEA
jgi:hypothetical protein